MVKCCLCNKVKAELGWNYSAVTDEAHLSHGYCPDCMERVLAVIENTPVEHTQKVYEYKHKLAQAG